MLCWCAERGFSRLFHWNSPTPPAGRHSRRPAPDCAGWQFPSLSRLNSSKTLLLCQWGSRAAAAKAAENDADLPTLLIQTSFFLMIPDIHPLSWSQLDCAVFPLSLLHTATAWICWRPLAFSRHCWWSTSPRMEAGHTPFHRSLRRLGCVKCVTLKCCSSFVRR